MLYATWSEGFRPGGINRRGTIPPYKADFLTNFELGFKTTLANNRVRFNGALFQSDWDDFQYSFLGANGLTEIRNAGQAQIQGVETDFIWQVTDAFTLSSSLSYIDAKTTADYCGKTYVAPHPLAGQPVTDCSDPEAPPGTFVQAPKGQELPVQPKFKANAVARSEIPLGSNRGYLQLGWVYQDTAWSDLRTAERELLGKQPAFSIVDFSTGLTNESWGLELFVKNVFDERAEIARTTQCSIFQPDTDPPNSTPLCGLQPYTITNAPRSIGLTFTKNF
jgi:iron complex outermembrane recepter protein